jgi:hypothetical protein
VIVHELRGVPPPELARALAEFESQFVYPLGRGGSFRISHGEDYSRFFRAMGEGVSFVAEREGIVLGTLGAALRQLTLPDGSQQTVVYLGDLKVSPAGRGGRVLIRLSQAAQAWCGPRSEAAFSVVMDGTQVTPEKYTGRLGIPTFRELGKVMVLRLSTEGATADARRFTASRADAVACYRQLSLGRYASPEGNSNERSEIEPVWLVHPNGGACGCLEDTRRAKRLISADGGEMLSAHLSCFACRTPGAGVELLAAALRLAGENGFPAMFVSVAAPDAEGVCELLDKIAFVAAPATIHGAGLSREPLWNINSAEI